MASGWTGSRVTADRAYWAMRILEAEAKGRPLLCPFCQLPMALAVPWDIDHDEKRIDGGRLGRGNQRPAHRLAVDCPGGGNRSDGARAGNARRSRARRRVRR